METAKDLYDAILARYSVRRYAGRPLPKTVLARVRAVVAEVEPLVRQNRFRVLVRDVAPGENLVRAMGAYGRIVSPPHYLVPYETGETGLLTDLGYRTEQIAVRLTALGIGTCFIGSLGREGTVRERFGLPAGARIGAFLVLGYPATGLPGRAFNALVHWAVGAANKLPADRLYYNGTFERHSAPPRELAPLIEAARSAPSAGNGQPWRFLWHDSALYVFVLRKSHRYVHGAGVEYRLFDAGTCMANVSLALEASGGSGQWQLLADGQADLPDHPPELQPIARLSLV